MPNPISIEDHYRLDCDIRLKLFCLIVRTDIVIVVVRRSWTFRRAAPYKTLIVLYCIVLYTLVRTVGNQ